MTEIKTLNDLKSLLESSTVAFATSTPDGRPNCIAVDGVKILNDKIVISDNFMNKTRKNLKNNPQISLAFWSQDKSRAYQIKGSARIFLRGKYKKFIDNIPENQGLSKKAAIVVTVAEIWDLANPKSTILHSNDMHGDFLAEVQGEKGALIANRLVYL